MPEPAGRGAAEPIGEGIRQGDGRAGRIRKESEILLGWRTRGLQREGRLMFGFFLMSSNTQCKMKE